MGKSSVRAVGWARSLPMSSEVAQARDWARKHLETLGWAQSAPETVDDVLLTISELVTNAHIHARTNAQLVMTWDNQCLHVAVHDFSAVMPTIREPDRERIGGLGMFLVKSLADELEARPCPTGKSVIACFRPAPGRAKHER